MYDTKNYRIARILVDKNLANLLKLDFGEQIYTG